MVSALRYLGPLIGLLCGLWLSIAALYPRWSLRKWQQKAEMLLGLSWMSFFGSFLYGVARSQDPRAFVLLHDLRLARMLLGGFVIGIFVTLVLEGSFRPFKSRGGKSGQPEPPPR